MRVIATIVGVLCAVASLWLAFTTWMDVSMAGFPDGHVTDYVFVAMAVVAQLGVPWYYRTRLGLDNGIGG